MTTQKTMRAMVLTGHGGIDKLAYRKDVLIPTPLLGEVLIQVCAAAVNNTDINTRIGWYSKNNDALAAHTDASWQGGEFHFPRIQGADVSGYIVAVGEGVDSARIGERVIVEPCLREARGDNLTLPWYFGSECDGGFAEFTTVAARHAYAISSSLSDSELASFPCSYSTAENMLTRAEVNAGDRVLITGASGGVGSAAIQLAKARNAYVIAMTSANKAQQLSDIGADKTVSRDADLVAELGENSIDVVIDLVAGNAFSTLLALLKPFGRYAVSGAIGGALVELDVRTLYLKDLRLIGCTVLGDEVFANLVRYIEQGAICPLVAATFPLSEMVKAQQQFEQKTHVGKIVLTIADSYTRHP